MAVLLGFYHLLLEREKMHRFNRFYLLGAMVISLAIPFITIPVYIEVESLPQQILSMQAGKAAGISHAKSTLSYWPYACWGLYILVTAALLIRFTRNIWHFINKVTTTATVPYKKATLVLLQEAVVPHTFMNYIFVNAQDHHNRKIEEALYTHELVHVIQKHTLDILFVELFKIFFWFNPLGYLYKRAIQLNHEFLADEQVIKASADTINYQHLLLEMASVGKNYALASRLTFSITKKRLIMMTKETPTLKANFLKAIIAPAIACVTLLLCTEAVAQEKPDKTVATPERIEVTSVTQKELDSLKQTDPVKYRGKKSDFLKTTMTSTRTGSSVSFDKKPEPVDEKQFSALSRIDPHKMKSIEILQLTEMERSVLKNLDPVKYNDVALEDYMAVKTSYLNDEGELASHTFYEKKPKF